MISATSSLTERPVSHDQCLRLTAAFLEYPTLRICRDLLHQYVFERELVVEGARAKDMSAVDNAAWQVLARDMMDQAMVLGFTVVRAKGGETPTVVPWSMCRVTIDYDKVPLTLTPLTPLTLLTPLAPPTPLLGVPPHSRCLPRAHGRR